MAYPPTLTDYASLIINLFRQFNQDPHNQRAGHGRPLTYTEESFIIFFIIMQYRRIHGFKSQRRWLTLHPEMVRTLGWTRLPHRTTISRRYKSLYTLIQKFIVFVGSWVSDMDECLSHRHLVEDKSLFRAMGPVWHQKHRRSGHIPEGLRNLDTDATWSKSSYHGWVYGYAIHMTCNEHAFPVMVCVETASVSESEVLSGKEELILSELRPHTLSADDAYTKAMRVRHWARRGVALLTPALRWVNGRYAEAYHRFIELRDCAVRLRRRRTSVEPLFDLISKVIGTDGPQKQLSVKRLDNVRPCLSIAVLSVQIAMIANSIWGLPHRNISNMTAAFQ